MVILIKWSKTIQSYGDIKLITFPRILNLSICSGMALSNLLAITPKGANLPLFQFKMAGTWVPLTDNRVRWHFTLILSKLHLSDSGFTFHTFRRSGATFAFNNNVTL